MSEAGEISRGGLEGSPGRADLERVFTRAASVLAEIFQQPYVWDVYEDPESCLAKLTRNKISDINGMYESTQELIEAAMYALAWVRTTAEGRDLRPLPAQPSEDLTYLHPERFQLREGATLEAIVPGPSRQPPGLHEGSNTIVPSQRRLCVDARIYESAYGVADEQYAALNIWVDGTPAVAIEGQAFRDASTVPENARRTGFALAIISASEAYPHAEPGLAIHEMRVAGRVIGRDIAAPGIDTAASPEPAHWSTEQAAARQTGIQAKLAWTVLHGEFAA